MALVIFISGCASQMGALKPDQPPALFDSKALAPQTYLQQQVKASTPELKSSWQLLAIRSSLIRGELSRARSLLAASEQTGTLSPQQKQQLALLQTQLALFEQLPEKASQQLDELQSADLPAAEQREFYRLQAQLKQQQGDQLGAARALIQQDQLTSVPAAKKDLQERIWRLLNQFTPFTLRAAETAPAPDVTTGWFELAATLNQYGAQPVVLIQKLQEWKQTFPGHPALENMPANLDQLLSIEAFVPKKIAVLLPLTGPLAPQGEIMQNGILMAYKNTHHAGELHFYDSNTQDLQALYQQLTTDGMQFVLGPLDKNRVELFTEINQTIPELALNQPEQLKESEQLFYFGLSPEGEAVQGANKIWQDGHRHPIIIAAKDQLGQRMSKAFEQRWQELSHQEVEIASFDNQQQIQQTVQQILGVSDSKQRIRDIKRLTGLKLKDEARSRRDTDAIYLISSPANTLLVKPFIDVSVSPYAKPIPVYASSMSRLSQQALKSVEEMNKMQLSEMPWLLSQDPSLMARVRHLWPTLTSNQLRLFALGYDSLSLVERLAQLRQLPQYSVQGLTGDLTVDSQGVVQRQLMWAHYENGRLVVDQQDTASDDAQ